MICEFCGDEFEGRPIKQAGQIFCSIDCANLAAEVGTEEEEEEYFDEPELDLNPVDDGDDYF